QNRSARRAHGVWLGAGRYRNDEKFIHRPKIGRQTVMVLKFHRFREREQIRRASPMSSVMIKCPMTGRAGSTAIETEPSSFRRLPKVTAHMRCPACGRD